MDKTMFETKDSFAGIWDAFTEEPNAETVDDDGYSEKVAIMVNAYREEIQGDLEGHAKEIVYIIKDAQAREKALRTEASMLQIFAKQSADKAAHLKAILKKAMENVGFDKLKTDIFSLNLQKPGGKAPLFIDENADLPDKYLASRMVVEIKKDELRKDLKAGIEVVGAALLPRDRILVIR